METEIIKEIVDLLNRQNICSQTGTITFHFMKQDIPIVTKDVIGGVLQDWFGKWLHENNIHWDNSGVHSQNWPDFILPDKSHLEFKAFDTDASPNFDLANFDAYTRSLLEFPERLDVDHLIFGYQSVGNRVKIVDFWVKKIWEMAGPSEKNILNLQVKQNIPVNIRPKDWRSKKISTFKTRYDFVDALNAALQRFHSGKYPNWFQSVCDEYHKKQVKFYKFKVNRLVPILIVCFA